jgi:hypothetical protein
MTMRHFAFATAALFAAVAAHAQIYKWQDENNKTVISDRPPVGKVREQKKIEAEAPVASGEPAKQAADREMEFRKRQKESQDAAEKGEKEQRAAAERNTQCESARSSLQVLESGERVSMRDKKGERYIIDDAQREQEIARARKSVEANCK